jgi:hypothetical protein
LSSLCLAWEIRDPETGGLGGLTGLPCGESSKQESVLKVAENSNQVLVFQPYPFQVGQKIHINRGPRRGDWEVVGVGEQKIKLRCPVSLREFKWYHFCYYVEERHGVQWPQKH